MRNSKNNSMQHIQHRYELAPEPLQVDPLDSTVTSSLLTISAIQRKFISPNQSNY